ncbi:DUF5808 domain-containing protein [Nitrolancea hollandica]|uniref:DUF5808 domain-containing protein n=1 Tax=Nitrolancea hollandica Lb TaxID=1129897 RepID=I4ED93_9BACT|nr:DUF5808 domain-containing protein [Nitrolancea hollandica]CCF82655.1 conserved exported hypothetical protein [Nitrolancea hollandica Lb]
MRRTLKVIAGLVAAFLLVSALLQQLRKPAGERSWIGRTFGMPYDLRFPTLERVQERWWNPNDERIFTPKTFGVGWDVNLYQVIHRLRGLTA